ncbi:hypothetical protein GII30_20735 [Gordonia amarae]|uniref:2-isopropylmalate synthase LeuA allosteric (dimerisation) domain-containing protein n=2 Tax=Gordonia amarae TaxID=36821 RepID=G7GWQ1_9ACTN|nr:hypothetical protein [Gordonia amarae]MCS3880876.1 hypothetical protein [Gordonia amarae]QHN19134.1 hypothetical protein GII35_21030 [Gordonia amarae]QHN23610.1 hypothetical protein GII34_20530 [Gordonia amarae]QHN32520.1 hypothetical protein GII32_20900 [Gordonia amarae]QHN41269.1 hypothetical protein GII30_20735 [Gordonia amarae]
MTWEDFTDQYSGDGHIRLAAYSTKPADRDMIDCQATLAVADDLFSLRATATGPVGAMTSILHDIGAPVAIVELRQRKTDDAFATYLLCEHNGTRRWAYGTGTTGDDANVNALVAGANRLHEPR